jgi:prepilin-type N-terminal cleavage/methylation domain-containing protein
MRLIDIKQMKDNQKGFTLTEVLIALAIFAIVGTSVMFALNASSKTIVSAHEITVAESLTRTTIEYVKRSAYDSTVVTTDLAASIDDATDVITVDSTDDFPASGIIQIEDELIRYTGKKATQFTGCQRGFTSTTAASHANNTPVADAPVYDIVNDVGIDLAGDPYYGDYSVDIGVLLLDPEADGTGDDDGIHKIMVEIFYQGRSVLTTEAYKVNR